MALSVECLAVSKSFGGVRALDTITVSFGEGCRTTTPASVVAVVGANGSGKSTLLDVLSGFAVPELGRVSINGQDVQGCTPDVIARLGVARTFQRPRVLTRLSSLDNVLLGMRAPADGSSIKWALPWMHSPSAGDAVERARAVLAAVGLSDATGRLAGELSYGQRRVLEIARAVVGDPSVLLFDEPTAGIDAQAVGRVSQLIASQRRRGALVIIVEHDMRFVSDVACRVLEMSDGCIVNDQCCQRNTEANS